MIGQTVSHYKILEELGSGGMGVVYKAEDTKLKRTVALKFLPPELTRDKDAKTRFVHEAQAASALQHNNICTIHEIGETNDGRLFICMDCYEGETLKDKIARGPVPVEEAIDIAIQISEGLSKAHRAGMVHRDIKPANITVTSDGVVKILDFGLAKLAGQTKVTKTGTTVGTVAYMSPEQASGQEVDARSDVFSLGAVLYELLTGHLPFPGDHEAAVLYGIMHSDPEKISGYRNDASAALQSVIDRALEKDRGERYQRVSDLTRELQLLTRPDSVPPRRAPSLEWVRRGPGKWILLASAATILVGAAWVIWMTATKSSRPGTTPSSATVAVFPFVVRGSESLGYLSEGVVDLLSTKLHGAGELRSVDPRALLGRLSRTGIGPLDPDQARTIASEFAAGLYVLGSILEVSGGLRIDASLYDATHGATPMEQAKVEGQGDEILDLLDDLAAQLLANEIREATAGIGTLTTESLAALKAYLEGERRFREGKFDSAVEAFQRACDEDSAFALAYYRLGIAAAWAGKPALARRAGEKAVRFRDRLSERDGLVLNANLNYRRGTADEAEAQYRTILGASPDDVESWYQLGEVLFHHLPLRGRSISESRDAWERVLHFEPDHIIALWHLARVTAMEGHEVASDSLLARALELSPSNDFTKVMRALRAFTKNDNESKGEVSVELSRGNDLSIIIAAWNVAVFGKDINGAKDLARLLTERSRAEQVRSLGHVILAHLELATGRWKAARYELDSAEQLDPVRGREYRALLSTFPFVDSDQTELAELRNAIRTLGEQTKPETTDENSFLTVHTTVRPQIHEYLLGLLSVRLGDRGAAIEHAGALESAGAESEVATLASELARSLRAQVARSQDRSDLALELLEQNSVDAWHQLIYSSPFYSQAMERFIRAELLVSQGRQEEAVGWYQSFSENSVFDLVYLAPSHLRCGEILESLGQLEKAAEQYHSFLKLWKDCDEELKPLVRQAEDSIVRLGGSREMVPQTTE